MDYRVLLPNQILDIAEKQLPQKLCNNDLSKENILYYVTTGSQFGKLVDRCGINIFNKPCLTGDYYINEVIKSKLLPAIEAGDEKNASMFANFYKIIVDNYGLSQVARRSNPSKETSMHMLKKAIPTVGDEWGPKLEKLYELAISKVSKTMGTSLVDSSGYDIYGDKVEQPNEVTPAATPVATHVATPKASSLVTQSTPRAVTPLATPTARAVTPLATPTASSAVTQGAVTPVVTQAAVSLLSVDIPSTPSTQSLSLTPVASTEAPDEVQLQISQVDKQLDSNNIVIVKGYEYYFINNPLKNYLKNLRK